MGTSWPKGTLAGTANADADGKRRCERQRQMRTAKAWGCSGGVAAADVFRDGFARFAAGHAQIVFRLQSQPGFGRDGEIDAEAERGIGGDGAGAVHDAVNPIGRDVEITCKAIDADTEGSHEFLEQNFAGVNRRELFGGSTSALSDSQRFRHRKPLRLSR